jgi:hypothetical protein
MQAYQTIISLFPGSRIVQKNNKIQQEVQENETSTVLEKILKFLD